VVVDVVVVVVGGVVVVDATTVVDVSSVADVAVPHADTTINPTRIVSRLVMQRVYP
jgi:hypothetical protein